MNKQWQPVTMSLVNWLGEYFDNFTGRTIGLLKIHTWRNKSNYVDIIKKHEVGFIVI